MPDDTPNDPLAPQGEPAETPPQEPPSEPAEPKPKPEAKPESMLDAIKASLKPEEPKKPEVKPDAKPEARPEEKYVVPQDLSPRGQQRFRELVSEIKTKDESIAQLSERVKVADGFLEAARGVGAGPEEFGMFFEFMGNLRSNPQQAIKFLENQISLIAQEYGLAAGGNEDNLLGRHADLREEVESYRMTRERALELAQAREQTHRRTQADQQARMQAETAQQVKVSEDKAIETIQKWAGEVQSQDIDWPKKKDVLFAQLAQLVNGVRPEHWLEKIQAAYRLMGPMKAPAPGPAEVKGRQPLRASTGSGAPQAGSMMEAIKQGLDSMRAG